MTTEIITIGDELLMGQVVDTNSAFMGNHLALSGIAVGRITSIGDDSSVIERTLLDAMERSEVVIVTGGLGPTKDDITKHTLAKMFHSPLVRHQPTYDHVERMMTERGVDFNASNRSQADVPQCCHVLHNALGTAPGMMFERNGHLLFSVPGVPYEMQGLIVDKVLPAIRQHFDLQSVIHHTVVVFGLAESVLSELISPWEEALPSYLKLAYLPNARGIRLRLSAYNVDNEKVTCEINVQFAELQKLIPSYYLGDEPSSVESALVAALKARGQTLAVAESCTGGSISARLTELAGVSEIYMGSVTAYSNSVKINILDVSSQTLELHGAVSEPVALEMARGARQKLGSHWGIATTGIAGPDGGSAQKPVGTVCIAVVGDGVEQVKTFHFGTLRHQNIERAATHALNMLRLLVTCQ